MVKSKKRGDFMILDEFDPTSNAIINPELVVNKIEHFPAITISMFSKELFEQCLVYFEPHAIADVSCANGLNPIYEVTYKGHRFSLYKSYVGEPMCIGDYEEIRVLGSKKLILLGNCGVLDKNIKDCGIIIPTRAIRDEGCSYHYAPASDFIDVNTKYIPEFKEVLQECGYPYVEGTTWTTDAFYRETQDKVKKRKEMGAICVEMECAGMQAMCQFRGIDFFQYFYAGDNLDHHEWQPRSIHGNDKLDEKLKIALLAFELGCKIIEKE